MTMMDAHGSLLMLSPISQTPRRLGNSAIRIRDPRILVGESVKIEPCDDAEVTISTFQDLEQIWILVDAGVVNFTGGKDNFKSTQVIAYQSHLGRGERVAAS